MDGRRDGPLSDRALDRELEAILDVEPSPSFVPRTRARLDGERIRTTDGSLWLTACAGGAMALVVGALFLWPTTWSTERPTAESVRVSGVSQTPAPIERPESIASRGAIPPVEAPREPGPVPESPRAVEVASPRTTPQAEREEADRPDVLIPTEETRGFELLLAGLNQGLLDGSMLPEEWGRRAEIDSVVIDIMPIEIAPLVPLTRLEGARP